jgi:hypothetical protein
MTCLDYISFGPHGPREPLTQPGHGMKVLIGSIGVVAASAALFYVIRQNGKLSSTFTKALEKLSAHTFI